MFSKSFIAHLVDFFLLSIESIKIFLGTALPFHKKLCPGCHNIPKAKEWQLAPETEGFHVFHVGKRNGRFIHWEPIFIGTHSDPLYDERLSWEGKSDKMTQV